MAYEPTSRDDLIDKAIEAFSRHGYAAANLAEIASASGLSRGPVYYHFKDKLGLFEAAYDQWERELLSNNARIYAEPGASVLKRLESTVYCCFNLYKRFSANFFTGIDALPELSEIKARFDAVTAEVYDMKLVAVRKAIKSGELRKDADPQLIVQMIYVLYDGLRIGWERPELPLRDEDVERIVAIHMDGIARTCRP